MILCEEIIDKFRKNYSGVHPLVLQRSIERARDSLDLFEILESIPNPPFSWNDERHAWVKNMDVTSKGKLKSKG